MGGPHVTVLDQEAFTESPDLDVVVRGEGEQTMLELGKAGFRGQPQRPQPSTRHHIQDTITKLSKTLTAPS